MDRSLPLRLVARGGESETGSLTSDLPPVHAGIARDERPDLSDDAIAFAWVKFSEAHPRLRLDSPSLGGRWRKWIREERATARRPNEILQPAVPGSWECPDYEVDEPAVRGLPRSDLELLRQHRAQEAGAVSVSENAKHVQATLAILGGGLRSARRRLPNEIVQPAVPGSWEGAEALP